MKIPALIFALAFLLASCASKKADVASPTVDCSTVTYSATVVPIINANCISCHGAGSTDGDYTTYAGLKLKVDNGTFANRVFQIKDMPQNSALTVDDLKRLQCWVDAGAPNN